MLMGMRNLGKSVIRWLDSRRAFRGRAAGTSGPVAFSPRGRVPIARTELAPAGVEVAGNVSEAEWVEQSLSDFGTVRSLLPGGFPAYARILHPAYLGRGADRPVRWSTVASWTGRTVHPLMQFSRVAGLCEGHGVMYPDPSWGTHPRVGSIPGPECRALIEVLRGFTATADACHFCLWEGYGHIDAGLYDAHRRVRAPGRDYLLFRGPLDAATAFIEWNRPLRGHSPNIWWPQDRAWCVATDIDLCDTFVGGSLQCIEAILQSRDLEALPTTLEARVDLGADTINAPAEPERPSR